ncbi:S8 family peptidase [Hyalangium versicolor]|uniref:S8 family peptidase n=1 Tax=Hyalangium versicolor TaxID=2861190 RepID=UPI001CCF4159|nr:S8 family serine peptidase [Hyalangium versicolor]
MPQHSRSHRWPLLALVPTLGFSAYAAPPAASAGATFLSQPATSAQDTCSGDTDDGSVNAPAELVTLAKERLAARSGQSPDEFTITNASPVTFPLQRVSAYDFKAVDTKGNPYALALTASGTETDDVRKLADAEQALFEKNYGRLTPDLVERLGGVADSTELEIAIQATVPAASQEAGPVRPATDAKLTEEDVNQLYASVDSYRQQVAQQVIAPIKARLEATGRKGEVDPLAPILHIKLSAKEIKEVARWTEVSKIFATQQYEPTMNVARSVVESDVVNSRGFSGSGVKVAEIEVGGGIAAGNPYLSGAVQDTLYACAHPHATWVAGTLRSTHATHRGVAPSIQLRVAGSCGGSPSQLSNRSSAASSWGARAFNLSFGSNAGTQPGSLDNYYDDLVQNGWRTVVISAGNSTPAAIVGSPGRAYNAITVGSMNDVNTIPWAGDVMSTFTSAQDPVSTHGDREKPEVAAPGTNITTTSPSSPWVGDTVSGTSFSAPITTGTAALLMQRNTGLQVWPEAVKAILMATAVHNVEGATRLSEQDGAGAIVGALADDVAHGVSGNWGGRSYSCSDPTTQTLTTMSLTSNRTTRVAVVWDTNPSYSQYANRPSADLDVTVIGPTGAFVASSSSWDNTYEMIEFTAPQTGVYTVRVTKYRCDLTPKWLGWSWYQRY